MTVRIDQDSLAKLRTYQDRSRHIRTDQDISGQIKTAQDSFRQLRTAHVRCDDQRMDLLLQSYSLLKSHCEHNFESFSFVSDGMAIWQYLKMSNNKDHRKFDQHITHSPHASRTCPWMRISTFYAYFDVRSMKPGLKTIGK